MLCPNDHMVMNHSETDGISIHKCPVCGSVRLAGQDSDKLAYGGVELYPYAPRPIAEPVQEAPLGAGADEQRERSGHEGISADAHVYGAPEQSGSEGGALDPYSYLPKEFSESESGDPEEAYGMPPEEFGRAEEAASNQAVQGSFAFHPVQSKI
jgi:Zn-finger nucleic acid-binding protein